MKLSRLLTVGRLDLWHYRARPLFWFWAVLVFFCALALASGGMKIQAGDSATGGLQTHLTSAFNNAFELTLLGGLFYTFFVAFAAGMELIRDREVRIEALLHSTPLRASEYVWGKFLAALACSLGILAFQVAAGMFFKHAITAEKSPELVGELSLLNYLQPALLFSVPLIVFVAGISFAIGERTRRPVLVNMFPLILLLISIFFFWTYTPAWLDPRIDRALMLFDPTGFRWLQQTWLNVDRGAEFYNTNLIGFDAGFFLSRLVLVGLGLGAVLGSQRHLARSLRGKRVGPKEVERALARGGEGSARPVSRRRALAGLLMTSRRPSWLRSLIEITRIELQIFSRHPGVWLFVPLLVLNAFGELYSNGPMDTQLLLTAGRAAVGSLSELTFTLLLFLMFFTVESLRREDSLRLRSISSSLPYSTWVLILGKLLAVSLLGAAAILCLGALCVVLMVQQGTVPVEVEPFLIVYGLLLFPAVLFWNAFIACAYALTRNRFATYAIGLGVSIAAALQAALGGMSWVWNWSLIGALRWTDLGPFELDREPLLLNRLMVLGAGLLFLILTVRIFPRRAFDTTRLVVRLRPGSLARTVLRLSPWIVVPLGLGLALQGGVNDGPGSERAVRQEKRYWAKNFRTWADAPNPDLADVEVELELKPKERWLHSKGVFELTNPHQEPLERIALTGAPHWGELSWTLNGEPHEPDDRQGLYVFTLLEPLASGARCRIGFDFEGTFLGGYSKNGAQTSEFILESGVVLTSFSPSFVPLVGYQEGIGVDEGNRYDAREYPDDFHEGLTRPIFGPSVPFPVRVRITAPEQYTLNSVGILVEEHEQDGLRTAIWESDEPVRFFNVVGGKLDVRRGEGTAVFYHPSHAYNLDEMIEALDGARRWYSAWFYPFPWQELRVTEFAKYAAYAQGFPTNISFSEEIGFLTKNDAQTNAPFFVTAHEAAHQWWGSILMPGEGPGGNLLSEGTANLSTILLFEAVKGLEPRIEFCKRLEETYNERRVVDSERELVKVDGSKDGDTTLTYDKMGWACWMLMNHLGRENGLAGVRSFIEKYTASRDHPVIQDFLAHLRPFAPDLEAYDAFTRQWFFEIVLPEYELKDVVLEPAGAESDTREVRFTLRNLGTGTMPVDVAVQRGERFPEEEDDAEDAGEEVDGKRVLHSFHEIRTTVTLGAGEVTEVILTCGFEPERILIDPDALILQRGRKKAIHRF